MRKLLLTAALTALITGCKSGDEGEVKLEAENPGSL